MLQKSCASLEEFFMSGQDGLYYLSHASILVILSGKRFLFDPVLAKPPHLGSWLFYPEMKMDPCLLNVDAVFVSHQHQDHFDVDFLKLLPSETKIYIVSGRPQFAKMFENHGIKYIEIPENGLFDLGDGISCFGVTHEYNGIDSALAISNGKFTAYHGNDCFLSGEKLRIVKQHYPTIDVACIPFAYVHWYPFLLDDVDDIWREEEAERLINKYLEIGFSQILDLRPAVAIPFGANMFYFDDIDSDHNKAVVSPLDFKDYAIKTGFELEHVIKPLFAGDAVISSNASPAAPHQIVSAAMSKSQLLEGLKNYIDYVREVGTGFDEGAIRQIDLSTIADVDFVAGRISHAILSEPHSIYISNADHPEIGFVQIQLHQGKASRVKHIDDNEHYHWFKLTDLAYKAYFSQKFNFNEIVASSRFRLSRSPNTYNIDVLKIINNAL
jgi:L-ascorbate metabolism protein UlaG (beta-lactamase superfamily)